MTREEAIYILKAIQALICPNKESVLENNFSEAFDTAIEALTEPKTIIGIDIPYGSDKGLAAVFKGKNDKLILEEVKEIMSVVRCKDCYWYDKGKNDCDSWEWCKRHKFDSYDEGFCSWGERREVEDD